MRTAPALRTSPLPLLALAAAMLLGLGTSGCSVRKMAVNALADSLSSTTGGAIGSDEDLEFVGDAVPFALKLMEILADQAPDHVGVRQALASGFTQYAVVFIQFPADQAKYDDYEAHRAGNERARKMFLRANGYALDGLELGHPGFAEGIRADTAATLNDTTVDDVPLLYWLGASWLMAISNAREDPELIGELPLAAACLHRALELDGDWDRGAIHEALISLEPSLPEPGGVQRAEEHFARAVELSGGLKASPYVSLATSICIKAQERARFESLLGQALAVDLDASPSDRMANTYAQRKARFLLDQVDDLFLE